MTAMSINRPRTPPRTPPTRAPVSECCVDCVDAVFPVLGAATIVVETSGSILVVAVVTGNRVKVCVVFVTSGRSAWTTTIWYVATENDEISGGRTLQSESSSGV